MPCLGTATRMKAAENDDLSVFDRIEHAVREAVQENPTNRRVDDRSGLGELFQLLDREFDGHHEFRTENVCALGIPRTSLSDVGFSLGREADSHSLPDNRDFTSAHNDAAERSSRWSLSRRSSSSSWLCGIGSDAGSATMLSQIASTARRRSAIGCSRISSMGVRGMS